MNGTRIVIVTEGAVDQGMLEAMDEAIGVPHSTAVMTDKPIAGVEVQKVEYTGDTLSEEDHRALFAVFSGDFQVTRDELEILYKASNSPHFGEDLRQLLEQAVGPNTANTWREQFAGHSPE